MFISILTITGFSLNWSIGVGGGPEGRGRKKGKEEGKEEGELVCAAWTGREAAKKFSL